MNELEELKKIITFEDIFNLLYALGADPQRKDGYIIARTICHNGSSHKLYYYENTKLFRCYTDCEGTFDIAELVMKVFKEDNMTLSQAIKYLKTFFNIEIFEKKEENNNKLEDWKILNRYKEVEETKENRIIEMKYYNEDFLNNLPQPHILNWEKENISYDIIKRNNIRYDPVNDGIIIPHYDENSKLIGIRERTLIKEKEENGKYRPLYFNNKMYNHPLGFALYNLNNSKENIKNIKKAILFEGEKSCLSYATLFGTENDISVCCCGSSLSSYQLNLLLNLGVEEIIIAFDRQFISIGDEEFKRWTKKLTDLHKKYNKYIQISFMFDKKDLLDYKMSPIEKGIEVFQTLFKERIRL